MYEHTMNQLKGRFPFLMMMTDKEIKDFMIRVQQASRLSNLEIEEILAKISREMESSMAHA